MSEFMVSVFGEYLPVDGGGINWQYVGSVAIFCIVLWSVLSLICILFKRK